MGTRATFHSTRIKRIKVTTPKRRRQMTVADFHGYDEPPRFNPTRTMTVPPTILRHPGQSIALGPATRGVFGVLSFSVHATSTNTSAVHGTGRSQQIVHCSDRFTHG